MSRKGAYVLQSDYGFPHFDGAIFLHGQDFLSVEKSVNWCRIPHVHPTYELMETMRQFEIFVRVQVRVKTVFLQILYEANRVVGCLSERPWKKLVFF